MCVKHCVTIVYTKIPPERFGDLHLKVKNLKVTVLNKQIKFPLQMLLFQNKNFKTFC